jgi:hypothetical protein
MLPGLHLKDVSANLVGPLFSLEEQEEDRRNNV